MVTTGTRCRPAVALALLLLACGSGGEGGVTSGGEPPEGRQATERRHEAPPRDHAWVIFGSDTVVAEVARTTEEREQGLMFRDEVPQGTGMLFVFVDEAIRSFWMRNTYVPLDVAWMNAELRIVDIQQMEPETTTLHEGDAPAMFALEVPMGWYAAHGVRVGDVAEIVFGR